MTKALAAAAAAGLLLAGCTDAAGGERDANPAEFGIAWHECADQIEIALTTEHRCGTLTVPLDRGAQDGDTLGLAVVQVWPTAGVDGEEVALSVGFNFGEPMQPPGDMHALAERIGVPVVALAPRGVGEEGGTSLGCPELDGLGEAALNRPDHASHDPFVEAVRQCHDRLTGDGVELDAFGIDDLARDVEALRVALGVDRWYTLVSYGELSRVTDTYASAHGDRIRAIVEDSPAPSGHDSFATAGAGQRSALEALFAECAAEPACARRYPDLEARWPGALERVAAKPLTGSAMGGPVLIDAPKFVRAVRSMLGDGPAYVPDIPRIITIAAEGRLHPTLASVVTTDPDHCLGHRPICTKPGFSLGGYLSQACPELGTSGAAGDDPLFRQVFVDSPYADACEVWDVEPAEPPPAPDVPTLVLTGDLDAWSRPEWFERPVVVRGAVHDVAGSSSCVFDVRNPWIADPTTEPDPSPCDNEPFPAWD